MKKMVRLLSVLMVIVMMFSMSTSAFAMVKGENKGASIVFGGGSSTAASKGSGNITIGGDVRPFDDRPNGGLNVGPDTGLERSDDEGYVKKYSGTGDYSSIENSDDPNVILNEDFLKCVHDNYDNPAIVDEGTLNFALGFFGEDIVMGEGEAENVEQKAEENVTEIGGMEETVLPDPSQPIVIEGTPENYGQPAEEQLLEEQTVEVPEQVVEVPEQTVEVPEQTVEVPEQAVEVPEQIAVPEAEQMAARKVIHAEAIAAVTSSPETNVNGRTLSSQLNGGTLTMSKPFDICNSTDYRVTIDLNGTTINYSGSEAAFVIKGKSITFTNGTINGDGFYVTSNGILNLGGWINVGGLDITVNADNNAVYVDGTGTAVIAQGTTLKLKDGAAPSGEKAGTVYVEAGGSLRMTGGFVFGRGTCPAVNNNGYFLLNGTGEDVNSSYANVNNSTGIAVLAQGSGATDIYSGTILGETGVTLKGTHKLSMYNGTVTGTGGPTAAGGSWNDGNTGAAIAASAYASEAITVSGGALRSQKTAAVMASADGSKRIAAADRANIKTITLSSSSIITQQADDSDYQVAKYTVNGVGYSSLKEALDYVNSCTDGTTSFTIKMGADDETAEQPEINAAGKTVSFIGNGHELVVTGGKNGFNVKDGTVTIQNVVLTGDRKDSDGINVTGGNVTIGDSVTIRLFNTNAIHTNGANAKVKVSDVYLSESVGTGIFAEKGLTTVTMVKDDCFTPVNATSTDNLEIRGGWFLYKEAKTGAAAANTVSTYVDPSTSNVQYVTKDKYYEVLYNTTPTVEIISAEAYSNDGNTPYIVYDKGDATPIVFNVNPELVKITAVAKDTSKGSYPIFATEVYTDVNGNLKGGVKGNVRIADNEVLMNCPAGAYDLQFTFANGYVLKDKLNLYVYPRYVGIYEIPNITLNDTTPEQIVKKYCTSDNAVGTYNVADGNNFAIIMSELPDKLAIGSDPNGKDVIYLENFLNTGKNNPSWKQLGSDAGTTFAGDYVYFLSYADLNNLAAGQNYVFTIYDDITDAAGDGAIHRYPFTLKNSSVSISPSSVEWSKLTDYANFTVLPDVLDYEATNPNSVYIDGEKVDKAYWTYNKDTHVLSIKASYLGALDHKEHTLEVLTSQGKVGATVSTKIGLSPKNLDYHVYGGAKSLTFAASDKINKDGGVWIGSSNPTKLDPSCYVWNSDTEFTLSSAFLNRLNLGTYYISAYVWNGEEYEYTTTSFKVISASQASYNPSTGDNSNIYIWLIVLALSAVAIVVILLPKFRKKPATEGAAHTKKQEK